MIGACSGTFFWPRPLGPWGGAKRSNIVKFQLQSQYERFFILNFVCVLTNERYKTYQTGFSFCRLGNVLGVGLGYLRVQNSIPSGGLSVMPKGLDQIQPNLVCELLTCLEHATAKKFVPRPLGPLGGVKRRYHLISITRSISNIFIPNFVCVFKNKRYKTYQTGFLFCRLGHAPGVGLLGVGDAQVVIFFSNMVMWHIKSTEMTSRTECK